MRYISIVVLAILLGCNSGPQDGEVWEEKLTEERVKIETGNCQTLYERQISRNEGHKRTAKEIRKDNSPNYDLYTDDALHIEVSYEWRREKDCVGFEIVNHLKGIGPSEAFRIATVDEFLQDYMPVGQ